MTPEEIKEDLTQKVQILTQIKSDFEAAKGERIISFSIGYVDKTITFKPYLENDIYATQIAKIIDLLNEKIENEIQSHQNSADEIIIDEIIK